MLSDEELDALVSHAPGNDYWSLQRRLIAQAREANLLRKQNAAHRFATETALGRLRELDATQAENERLRAEVERLRALTGEVAERWCSELESVLPKDWMARYAAASGEGRDG